ncbi:serine protease 27-like [Oppia nitens]|uniref:serine protease 27-like n=1 Tax=Oppia nitens TaxID=1686743 RepID=UPI0023D9AE86|nr:serine protease 27-like [Oppia nitens]
MKETGEGRLEAWNVETNIWMAVCGEHWNTSYQSETACRLLGYQSLNETRIRDETTTQSMELYNRIGTAINRQTQMKVLFDKSRNKGCRNGKNMTVHLKCNHFECGKSYTNLKRRKRHRRIVGGTESHPGQWPWLVALHGGPEEVFFCGGVLISERWVLTAAHCIGNQTDVSGWTVNLGITRRTASPFSVRKRKVLSLIKHPGFNPSANMYSSDIALILLDSSVDFDEFLRPICLPPSPTTRIPTGTRCTVIGWGKTIHDDDADYLSAIHEVEVPIVDHNRCAEWYARQDVYIPQTMLCAGYESGRKDACQGDSGGPLLCRNEHHNWFVAGVVSWGINCAQPELPGIYTNVPMFLDWIQDMSKQIGYPLVID